MGWTHPSEKKKKVIKFLRNNNITETFDAARLADPFIQTLTQSGEQKKHY